MNDGRLAYLQEVVEHAERALALHLELVETVHNQLSSLLMQQRYLLEANASKARRTLREESEVMA